MTEDPAPYSKWPIATIVGLNRSGSSPSLELRVNIEDRDHVCVLPLDALRDYEMSGPAAVDALSRIADALGALREPVGRLAGMTDLLATAVGQRKGR